MELIDREKLKEGIAWAICVPCVEEGQDYEGVRCRSCQCGDIIEIIECSPTIENLIEQHEQASLRMEK